MTSKVPPTVEDFEALANPNGLVPMVFLQGTRDEFAELELLKGVCKELGAVTTLKLFQDADHSFHVPARTGRKDADVRHEMLDTLVEWISKLNGTEQS